MRKTGFNRYMVECECVYIIYNHTKKIVLIDTWWNVNGKEASLSDLGFKVLIDTWWNVNTPSLK